MRRPEGTRRERSGGGMPRRGSCEAAGVIMSFAQRSLIERLEVRELEVRRTDGQGGLGESGPPIKVDGVSSSKREEATSFGRLFEVREMRLELTQVLPH